MAVLQFQKKTSASVSIFGRVELEHLMPRDLTEILHERSGVWHYLNLNSNFNFVTSFESQSFADSPCLSKTGLWKLTWKGWLVLPPECAQAHLIPDPDALLTLHLPSTPGCRGQANERSWICDPGPAFITITAFKIT